MKPGIFNKKTASLSFVWSLLSAATVLAWFMGQHTDGPIVGLDVKVCAGILLVASLKVLLVMAYFMEVRWAPWPLIGVAAAWVTIEYVALVWIFAH